MSIPISQFIPPPLSKDLTIWYLCARPSCEMLWLFLRSGLLFEAMTELEIVLHTFFPSSSVYHCFISVHLARTHWMSHWHPFLSGCFAARLPWTSLYKAGYFTQSVVHLMYRSVWIELSKSLHNARQLNHQELLLLYRPWTFFLEFRITRKLCSSSFSKAFNLYV